MITYSFRVFNKISVYLHFKNETVTSISSSVVVVNLMVNRRYEFQ